jgi:hypothetical protein
MKRRWIRAALLSGFFVGGIVVCGVIGSGAATGWCDEPAKGAADPPSVKDDENSPVPEGQAAFFAEVIVVRGHWEGAKEEALAKKNIEEAIKDVPIDTERRAAPLTLGAAMLFSTPSIYTPEDYQALRAWLERGGLVTYSTPAPQEAGHLMTSQPGGESERYDLVLRFPHEAAKLRHTQLARPPLVETKVEYEWTVARAPRRDEYGVQARLVQRDRPRGAAEFETQGRPLTSLNWMTFRAPPNRVVVFPLSLGEALAPADTGPASEQVPLLVSPVLVLHTGPRAKELTATRVEPRFALPERVLAGENDVSRVPTSAPFASPRATRGGGWPFRDVPSGAGGSQYGFGPGGQRIEPQSRGGTWGPSSGTAKSSGGTMSSGGGTSESAPGTSALGRGASGLSKASTGGASNATLAETPAPQDALAAFALEREVQSLRTAERLRARLASDPQARDSATRELETQLNQEVASAFDARQRVFAARIAEFEQQLARTRRTYDERVEAREEIVRRRLAELRSDGSPAAESTRAIQRDNGDGAPRGTETGSGKMQSTASAKIESTANPRTVPTAGADVATGRAVKDEPAERLAFIREGQRLQQAQQAAETALAQYRLDQESMNDNQESRARMAELAAQVERISNALRQWRDSATAQLRLAELDVHESEVAEQYARSSLDRLTQLSSKGAVSSSEVDAAKVLLEQSKVRTKRAQILLEEYQRAQKDLSLKP